MKYYIHIDGGCKGNGTGQQNGYGSSLAVSDAGKTGEHKRYNFGDVTNNQAEYMTLQRVLFDLMDACQNFFKTRDEVYLYMDSALVVNQVNGVWRIKDPELAILATSCQVCLETLREFGLVIQLAWVPRDEIFRRLGH